MIDFHLIFFVFEILFFDKQINFFTSFKIHVFGYYYYSTLKFGSNDKKNDLDEAITFGNFIMYFKTGVSNFNGLGAAACLRPLL